MEYRDYYRLTKPGIIYGNAITLIAGFLLASRIYSDGYINLWLLLAALVGLSFVIASGCVFNNYIDRDTDAKMERTKDRPLVVGRVSLRAALIYGTCLGIIGFLILALHTNLLATGVAALGFIFYVFMYSMWFKRRSSLGALIGSISGAVPPVVGYVAASGRFDIAALLLFLIMVLWQVPHFFSISIYRMKEYAAAHIPVLSVKKGIRITKIEMLLYVIAFVLVAPLLSILGYTGYVYFLVALLFGLAWLVLCIKGFWISNDDFDANARWARRMFFLSLFVMMATFITIAISGLV
jgi:protoheme IX farnesyltransferase